MFHTILLTGGSGFVAAFVLNVFLKAGYKGSHHSTLRASRQQRPQNPREIRLRAVIRNRPRNLSREDAFNEAVQGVDGIIHLASPFFLDAKDMEKEIFEPAVSGTVSLLTAVKNLAPSVKRVVITSSVSAVLDM